MRTAIKLELVVAKGQANKILEIFEQAGINEYSVLNVEKGKGNKDGEVQNTGLSDVNNIYFLVVCTLEQKDKVIPILDPFFKIAGGICFYSEVVLVDP